MEDAPKELGDILNAELLKDVSVLILDAPTCAKSSDPPATDGWAAIEWAGKQARKGNRHVIHTTSLRAFSMDERILSSANLENKVMRPWTRQDFVGAMSDKGLKQAVCATLGFNPDNKTADDIVDATWNGGDSAKGLIV